MQCQPFQKGSSVQVFSESQKGWFDANVAETDENSGFVRVEFEIQQRLCCKRVHVSSSQIRLLGPGGPPSRHGGFAIADNTLEHIPAGRDLQARCRARELPAEYDKEPEKYYVEMDGIWNLLEAGQYKLIRGDWLLKQSKAVRKDWYFKQIRDNLIQADSTIHDSLIQDDSLDQATKAYLNSLRQSDLDVSGHLTDADWDHLDTLFGPHLESGWQPLPAFQDLPEDACVPVDILRKVVSKSSGCSPIISISHSWLDINHPDPQSVLLDQIAPVLMSYLAKMPGTWKDDKFTGAVFFAWCSMFQPFHERKDDGTYVRRDSEELGPRQKGSFYKSLQNMHIWYAHKHVETWLFTQRFDYPGKPYRERGWPTWERTIAHLLKKEGQVLDLGQRDYAPPFLGYDWSDEMSIIRRKCHSRRDPPLLPDKFDQVIMNKYFTNGHDDLESVKANYRRNFESSTLCVSSLELRSLRWDETGLIQLLQFVSYCKRLQPLDLGGNRLGSSVMRYLVGLAQCPDLRHLILDEVELCACGCHDLGEGLMGCAMLESINLRRNQIHDDGACTLAAAFIDCKELRGVILSENSFGDIGASAVVRSLRTCKVSRLDLARNRVRGEGLEQFSVYACLEWLSLEENRIPAFRAKGLAQAVSQCKQLRSFDISGNDIDDVEVPGLEALLRKHPSLCSFKIGKKTVRLRKDAETQTGDCDVDPFDLRLFDEDELSELVKLLFDDGPESRLDMELGW